MWFVSHVCCCKRLVFIACVNLQVFSILLIPLVFDGPTTWRSSPPCHWPLGSWCSCGSCQRCAREASHWLATDRVSICDRLIRKWDIRYSQTSRTSDETCWLCGNCSCVCCYYDDTMEGRQLHLKGATTQNLWNEKLWPQLECASSDPAAHVITHTCVQIN